jgi:ubiquinol-cytochrome c reductase iron-sulfur subunit
MTTSHHHPPSPTAAEVDDKTLEPRARLAGDLDEVYVVHNQRKWPPSGTRAEKCAERSVALWFVVSAVSGLAFLGSFLFWPFEYVAPGEPGYALYALYTPIVGFTFGLSVLAVGIGVIARPARALASAPSVRRPAKPADPRGTAAGVVGRNSEAVR